MQVTPAAADRPSLASIILIDGSGRTITLNRPAERVVVTAISAIDILELLHADSSRLLTGAPDYIYRYIDRNVHSEALSRRGPSRSVVGSRHSLSIESIVALSPDLVVLPAMAQSYAAYAAQLERAGIPFIWQHGSGSGRSLADQTVEDIKMLGRATGRPEKAEEFADFYQKRYRSLLTRLEGATDATKPRLFFEFSSTGNERRTTGESSPYTALFRSLGAELVGSEVIPGDFGSVSAEYLLRSDPEVYIALGSAIGPVDGPKIGPGIDTETARTSLLRIADQQDTRNTTAIRSRRIHMIDVGLWISPMNIALFEAIAKWLHPEIFSDLDPDVTLRVIAGMAEGELVREGTYWISLNTDSGRIEQ